MRLTTILSIIALFIISVVSTNIYAQNEPTNFVALFQEDSRAEQSYFDFVLVEGESDAHFEVLEARDWLRENGRGECFKFRGIRPKDSLDLDNLHELTGDEACGGGCEFPPC